MPQPIIQAEPGAPLGSPDATPGKRDYWAEEDAAGPVPAAHPEYNPTPAEAGVLAEIGRRESRGDYSLLHGPGGMHVHDLSEFPDWEGFEGPAGTSHAAGKYGFEPGTYRDMAQRTGYHDFSPQSQDMNALALLRARGANSEGSWAASGPYQEPSGGRPVPMPPPPPQRPSGPQNQGPFQSQFDAWEAAPKDPTQYYLQKQNGAYSWVPKGAVPDPGVGPSPYYNRETDRKIINDAVTKGPNSDKYSLGTGVTDIGRGFNAQIANLLDLPATLTDAAFGALSAGMGWQPPTLKFGHPVASLLNKLGIDTEKAGEGWASTLGYGLGSGLGATLPMVSGGIGMTGAALANPEGWAAAGTRALGINPTTPLKSAINELAIGGGSGEFQQEAHELYKGQTGREGDIGDLSSQLIGGGIFNTLRTGGIMAMEKAWAGAHQGARAAAATASAQAAAGQPPMAPNNPEVQQFRSARGYDPNMPPDTTNLPLNPQTGQEVADAVLARELQEKLNVARGHVEALGTSAPEDSAAVLAEHSAAAKTAVKSFLQASRAEEQHMWSPEMGVNLDMPRDYSGTQNLYQQMKADHFSNTLRDPKSFPSELGGLITSKVTPEALSPTGGQVIHELSSEGLPVFAGSVSKGLRSIDTLGRGQDVRSRIGQMIEDESAVQGRAADAAKIGYLKKLRNSLADDMSAGGEGVDPQEIDAYRRAMATSSARAKLAESPEMEAFLRAGDGQALDKFLKTGPAGADAVKIMTGAAAAKYGSTGLLGAAQDALRQKYTDAVAPHGYVSMGDHARFMQLHGGILNDPAFTEVRQQLETAAAGEQSLNNTIGFGKPGGFGKSGNQLDIRQARAETYLQAPARTVIEHLEGVSNQFSATRAALEQAGADPTGAAALGLQHMIADRALYTPPDRAGRTWAQQNPGIIEAIERENPGFTDRLNKLMTPSSLGGIAKKLVDFGAAYVGAQAGGRMAEHMGSSMVMAGRGSSMVREIAKNGLQKLTGISSALVVDPRAAEAWGRTFRGMTPGEIGQNSAQLAADMLLFHSYVPGFVLGNLPIGPTSGTGQMGSPLNPAGPPSMQGPDAQPWYKSLPSYAPGAGRL